MFLRLNSAERDHLRAALAVHREHLWDDIDEGNFDFEDEYNAERERTDSIDQSLLRLLRRFDPPFRSDPRLPLWFVALRLLLQPDSFGRHGFRDDVRGFLYGEDDQSPLDIWNIQRSALRRALVAVIFGRVNEDVWDSIRHVQCPRDASRDLNLDEQGGTDAGEAWTISARNIVRTAYDRNDK